MTKQFFQLSVKASRKLSVRNQRDRSDAEGAGSTVEKAIRESRINNYAALAKNGLLFDAEYFRDGKRKRG